MQITVKSKGPDNEVSETQYPLQWGMGALEIYCDIMECDLDGLSMIDDQASPIKMQKAISTLIYAGLKNGCEVNEVPFELTMPKLRVYLDELPQDEFKAIMDDFANSKYLGKTIRQHLYGDLIIDEPNGKKKAKTKRTASVKS